METKKIEEIVVTQKPQPGDTSPMLCFIFAVLSFLFWANMMGILGEGAELAMGTVQIGTFVAYTVGSVVLLKKGMDEDGNVFFVFAAFFAGVGGLLNIVGSIAKFVGMPFSDSAAGICWVLCGLLLGLTIPRGRKKPLVAFLFNIFGTSALVIMGFMTLGVLNGVIWHQIATWSLFGGGVSGMMFAVNGINSFAGLYNFPPLGKPLFK